MAPKYSKEPGARYKYGSTKHKEEIHYEAVYENGLFNHNNPWLIKHDEELLNRAHRKESPYCIGEKLGRKPHSLACRLSKLAINHPMARYRFPPSWTPWRSHRGFFWSGLDRYIFSLATGKAGWSTVHISRNTFAEFCTERLRPFVISIVNLCPTGLTFGSSGDSVPCVGNPSRRVIATSLRNFI